MECGVWSPDTSPQEEMFGTIKFRTNRLGAGCRGAYFCGGGRDNGARKNLKMLSGVLTSAYQLARCKSLIFTLS